MRDIVAHHILDEQRREVDAHDREQQEEQIVRALLESRSEQILYLMYDGMQEEACHRSKQTDEEGENQGHLLVGNVILLPGNQLRHPALFVSC